MEKYISRKIIITTIIVLLVVGLLVSIIIYINSFSSVNISMNNCNSLVLYKSLPESDETNPDNLYENHKPTKTITKNGQYKLRKGTYRYYAQPINQDFQKETKQIIINEKTQNLSINLTYTQKKLSELYKIELPKIINTLNAKYPTQMKNYSLQFGKLYEDGNWFGGYLVPDNNTDKLQVILKQKGANIWEVAATPNITISSPQYPEIPKVVIDGVNVFPN